MKVNIIPYVFYFGASDVADDDLVNLLTGLIKFQPHISLKPEYDLNEFISSLAGNPDFYFVLLGTEYIIKNTKTHKIHLKYNKQGQLLYDS